MSAVWRHVTAEGYVHDRHIADGETIPFDIAHLIYTVDVDHVTIDFADGGRTIMARVDSAAEGVARLAKLDTPDRQCAECGGLCEIKHTTWCNEGDRVDEQTARMADHDRKF